MPKNVKIIQAINRQNVNVPKLKVCAYARVSTRSKEQAESYETQVRYFKEKIENNPLWEMVGIYADEAVTGTKIKGREEFQAMLQECENGNIDLVITKSLTRFARNTIECIQTIRKLKALGIGIYFEKENINTLTEKSELVLTILSSIAQGESEDFSGNNRWAIKKRFQDGTFVISEPAYGYANNENGNLVLNEDEAKIVRMMFEDYLNGKGSYLIAKKLNELKIPTKRCGEQWTDRVVKSILDNPVYVGDLLMQKTYTENSFPFEKKINRGEREQYLIEDDHEAIITRDEAVLLNNLKKYKARIVRLDHESCKNRYVFSGRLVCGDCGKHFRRKKVYIGKPNEMVQWSSSKHILDKKACGMKPINECEIHNAFIEMYNKLYTNQGVALEPFLERLRMLPAKNKAKELERIDIEIDNLTMQYRILNEVMKKGYIDTAIFMQKSNEINHNIAECRKRKIKIFTQHKQKNGNSRDGEVDKFIKKREKMYEGIR